MSDLFCLWLIIVINISLFYFFSEGETKWVSLNKNENVFETTGAATHVYVGKSMERLR